MSSVRGQTGTTDNGNDMNKHTTTPSSRYKTIETLSSKTLSSSSSVSPSPSSCCMLFSSLLFSTLLPFYYFRSCVFHFTKYLKHAIQTPSVHHHYNNNSSNDDDDCMTTSTASLTITGAAADASAEIDDLSSKTLCLSFRCISRFIVRFK